MKEKEKMTDAEVLARTLWGEAGGEGAEGMEAVALVALNRFRSGKWWGGYEVRNGQKYPSLKETCRQKKHFGCWRKDHPRYAKMLAAAEPDKDWRLACQVATRALTGQLTDFTNQAYFCHPKNSKPKWAEHHSPCYETEGHLFYNDI